MSGGKDKGTTERILRHRAFSKQIEGDLRSQGGALTLQCDIIQRIEVRKASDLLRRLHI